jgi:hypothetical protein
MFFGAHIKSIWNLLFQDYLKSVSFLGLSEQPASSQRSIVTVNAAYFDTPSAESWSHTYV